MCNIDFKRGFLLINISAIMNESNTLCERRAETPNYRFYKAKSPGINAGIIVAIVLPIIFVLIVVIGINYF